MLPTVTCRSLTAHDVSFEIDKGEFCCLLGTSGSGKSTLLNLMAGIEKASGGQILIKGKNIRKMSEKQLAKFRQKYLGFVFQSYNLLNSMTALENVHGADALASHAVNLFHIFYLNHRRLFQHISAGFLT